MLQCIALVVLMIISYPVMYYDVCMVVFVSVYKVYARMFVQSIILS